VHATIRADAVKLAAYQAPLLPPGALREAIELIRPRIEWCEAESIAILCCPEAVLGGLADQAADPSTFAIDAQAGGLAAILAPLASETVATIVGFTEAGEQGRLYDSAAVFHRGAVAGVYRKQYPAINRSIYDAGDRAPIFAIGGLTFGILICNDSNFDEPARTLASQGARVLFIPTNNALPPDKADVVDRAKVVDTALARAHRTAVVRADVAGRAGGLISHGCSWIVDAAGTTLCSARHLSEDLAVAILTF
jgi:predicted amidohydrolase